MTLWEYSVVRYGNPHPVITPASHSGWNWDLPAALKGDTKWTKKEVFDHLGQEGWELVAEEVSIDNTREYTFKRAKE
jgi:hypothetical protein